MSTTPINLNSRLTLFRKAPQLILLLGYGLGLLVLFGAASTWFIYTSVAIQTSGVLRPALHPLATRQPALLLERFAKPGEELSPGARLLTYTTSSRQIASASLEQQVRSSLTTLESTGEIDSQLGAQLRQTLGLLATSATPQLATASQAGWVLKDHSPPVGPVIRQAGEPLVELASIAQVTLHASVISEVYPGVQPGNSVKVLLADFSGKDVIGTLDSIAVSTTFEFPLGQFSPGEQALLKDLTTLTVQLEGTAIIAQLTSNPQGYSIALPLDALPQSARTAVKSRRTAHLQLDALGDRKLNTKWGSLTSQLVISFSGDTLPPRAQAALRTQLARGEREQSVNACWIQIATRRLFLRLFSS